MIEARQALRRVMAGEDLEKEEMEALVGQLMDGRLEDPMKAALLVALAMKNEAPSEIAGAAAAMRGRKITIPHDVANVVDTCGTGGDGKGTFNISTASAVVAAAAGVPIAKHGNRSVSSRSGSADVLAALGVPIDLEPEAAGRALESIGIAFLFAPRLHPAMKEVMPVRKSLGIRTLFNVLGPLTNPADAKRQVIGVYAASLVESVGQVLVELGCDHAMVVHGHDGLDEITTTGPTRVAEVRGGRVQLYDLDPRDFGVARATEKDLAGGGPEDNAALFQAVLEGQDGPLTEITALNAAAAIYVGGLSENLPEALVLARRALSTGAAAAKLDDLRSLA